MTEIYWWVVGISCGFAVGYLIGSWHRRHLMNCADRAVERQRVECKAKSIAELEVVTQRVERLSASHAELEAAHAEIEVAYVVLRAAARSLAAMALAATNEAPRSAPMALRVKLGKCRELAQEVWAIAARKGPAPKAKVISAEFMEKVTAPLIKATRGDEP